MRTSVWLTAGLALLPVAARPAAAKVNNPPQPGLHGLGYEDGLLLAGMSSNPRIDAEFRGDLARLDAEPEGPQKKADEAQFRSKWAQRIGEFSQSYRPGGGWQGSKISVAEAQRRVPWLAQLDQDGWKGALFQGLHDKLDAAELALIVARMQSLNNQPNEPTRAGLTQSLTEAKSNILAGAWIVVDKMIGEPSGDPHKTVRGYMNQLQREAVDRTPTVIASAKKQLEEIQAHPDQIAATIDGARTNPAASEAPVVVSPIAQTQPRDATRPALQTPPPAQPKPAGQDWLAGMAPPAPDTGSDQPTDLKLSPTARETAAKAATSTPVLLGLVGGGLLGAGIGLLLGGPIGALIGAAIGLIAGAAGGFGFLTR